MTLELPKHLEIWRQVRGTQARYDVSNLGRVRSWVNTRGVFQREPHVLHPTVGKNGYPVWCYRVDHKEVRLTVPVTVATAFFGPRPKAADVRYEVRHLDNDKLNNHVDNLVWGTSKQNADDRVRAGTTLRGERSPFAKLTWDQVNEIRSQTPCHIVGLAVVFGVSRQTIRRVLRNETWKVANSEYCTTIQTA
jgi:hypothetical protein